MSIDPNDLTLTNVPGLPQSPIFGPIERGLLSGAGPPGMPPMPSSPLPAPGQELDSEDEVEPTVTIYPGAVDYTIDLAREDRDALGSEIIAEIRKFYNDTEKRFQNVLDWRADFEMIPADGEGPWPGSARVRAPLTENACRGHHTKLNQMIIHSVPPFVVEAKTPEAVDAAPLVEEALSAMLEEADWKTHANQVHAELPQVGNVYMKITFEHEVQRQPRHQVEFDVQAYADYQAQGMAPTEAMQTAVATDRDGKAKMRLVWINLVKSSGVRFEVIPFEDGFVFPANIRDPEDAIGIGQRLILRGAELKQGARRGQFFQDAVDELLQSGPDGPWDDRGNKLDFSGISAEAGFGSYAGMQTLNREYKCYELCYRMDTNDDDELEWAVVTVHESGKLLRCQHLPYHHGNPYYKLFRYFTRARELFGMGVAEKIACVQDAATTVLCQLIDHADMSLNVFGNIIYEKSSGFNPNKFEWRMGRPIGVENLDGLKQLTLPQQVPEHYHLYQLFKDIADLTTASANPSLGQMTDSARTLGEVQIVLGQSNTIFEEVASGVARDWADVWDMVRWLCAQYGSGGQVTYRKTALPSVQIEGEDGSMVPATMDGGQMQPAPGGATFNAIPAEMMMAEVDLVPAGLKQLADMQSRVQQASLVQSTLLQHPLVGQSVDAQVVMLDEYLQALRYPQRQKLMEIINQVAAQVKQQQMLAQMMAAAMPMAGAPGVPGAPGGPPGGGGPPEAQGPRGAPHGFPQGGPATGPNGIPMPPQPGGQRT